MDALFNCYSNFTPPTVICRDLHWGNVLVKTTEQKKGSFLLNGAVHMLETKGVLVRIIDYSLSRLEIGQTLLLCCADNTEPCLHQKWWQQTCLLPSRWSDRVLWYLQRRGAVHGPRGLPVWYLQTDERGEQVGAHKHSEEGCVPGRWNLSVLWNHTTRCRWVF